MRNTWVKGSNFSGAFDYLKRSIKALGYECPSDTCSGCHYYSQYTETCHWSANEAENESRRSKGSICTINGVKL